MGVDALSHSALSIADKSILRRIKRKANRLDTIGAGANLQANSYSSQSCSASDIEIKSVKWHVQDKCSNGCPTIAGAATLENKCSESIGIQIKAVGLDKSGAPLSAHDWWISDAANIPPGNHVFSIEYKVDYDPKIKRIDLSVNQVQRI